MRFLIYGVVFAAATVSTWFFLKGIPTALKPSGLQHREFGLLILVLAGGEGSEFRADYLERTWWNKSIDWGVNYRAFRFINEPDRRNSTELKNEKPFSSRKGDVNVDCNRFDRNQNKCCVKVSQLRFALRYLEEWPGMEWLLLLDDDHYPVLPNLEKALKKERRDIAMIGGINGCVEKPCVGFCGGAGIYINRKLLETIDRYFRGNLDTHSIEDYFLEKCQVCKGWADITMTEVIKDIMRREIEITNPVSPGDIQTQQTVFQQFRPEGGLDYLPSKDVKALKKWFNNDVLIFHYDYRFYTHEVHNFVVRNFARTVDGTPAFFAIIPYFEPLSEGEPTYRLERKKAEEARKNEERDKQAKDEEEAKKRSEEEAKKRSEEEAKRKAEEEAKRKAEEEAKRKAEEEAKEKAEEEAKRKAEEEPMRKAAAGGSQEKFLGGGEVKSKAERGDAKAEETMPSEPDFGA